MTATLTKDGLLVIPKTLRKRQKLQAGDEFEIIADADESGVIELRRVPRRLGPSWVDVLLSCPVKGWMQRLPRRIEPMRRVRL